MSCKISLTRFWRILVCLGLALSLSTVPYADAGQVPGPANAPDIPVSSRDRVYLSDQTSGTVSVVDPASNKLLGVIQLGKQIADTLSAVYRGQSLVHGMGFSPDHKTLAIVAVGSNALVFIDTNTNNVKHITYVGRAPHEAMWTPNGKEVWVTVRGEDYIQVLDGTTYQPTRRVQVPSGPGMTVFSPDGKYAYICSSFTPQTVIVDTVTYKIAGRVQQSSPFCPNIAATPDGKQVWFTLKDTGKTQIISAQSPFRTIATLETGPITNHVNFVTTKAGQFAYITVGGLRQVKVFTTDAQPKQVTAIPVGDNPHGLWPSGDGSRMYVGLQLSNAVVAIDTATNRVVATVDIGGQAPMAVMYVPEAVTQQQLKSEGLEQEGKAANLVSVADARKNAAALHIHMVGVGSKQVQSSVVLNKQGLIDSLEAAISGLTPGKQYILGVSMAPDGSKEAFEPIASFTGGPDGAASVAVLGPFHDMLMGGFGAGPVAKRQHRFLVIASAAGKGGNEIGPVAQVQQVDV